MAPKLTISERRRKMAKLNVKMRKSRAMRVGENIVLAGYKYTIRRKPVKYAGREVGIKVELKHAGGRATFPQGEITLEPEATNLYELYQPFFQKTGEGTALIHSVQSDVRRRRGKGRTVRYEQSGRGLGGIVVEELLEEAKKHGCKYVACEVNPRNTASRKMFERMGFKVLAQFKVREKNNNLWMVKNVRNMPGKERVKGRKPR